MKKRSNILAAGVILCIVLMVAFMGKPEKGSDLSPLPTKEEFTSIMQRSSLEGEVSEEYVTEHVAGYIYSMPNDITLYYSVGLDKEAGQKKALLEISYPNLSAAGVSAVDEEYFPKLFKSLFDLLGEDLNSETAYSDYLEQYAAAADPGNSWEYEISEFMLEINRPASFEKGDRRISFRLANYAEEDSTSTLSAQ